MKHCVKKAYCAAFIICVLFPVSVFAQQKTPAAQNKPVQAADAAKQNPAAPGSETSIFSYQAADGAVFVLGGGYYSAIGDMASILKPSWSVRLAAQNNNLSGTIFGLGFDVTYAMLKDMDVSGGIMYTTMHPNVTATFSFFDWFDIQAKAGPGVSILTSTLNGGFSPSVSLTLGGGAGILKVFGGHYIFGLEGDYYYFFQRESSRSYGAYCYMGYRL